MRFYLCYIFFLSLNLLAQDPIIYHSSQFEKIQINDNSKLDHVYSLEEDDEGYLWIAERSGLYRFDGDRFTNITLPNSLGKTIRHINLINKDTILIATTKGLGIVNTKNFKVDTRFFNANYTEYFLENNFIRSVVEGKNNTFWVFTKTAIHLMDQALNLVGSSEFEKHPDILGANPITPISFPVDDHRLIYDEFYSFGKSEKSQWYLIDITKGTKINIDLEEFGNLRMGTCFQIDAHEAIMVSKETPEAPQAFYHYNYDLRKLMRIKYYDPSLEPVLDSQGKLESSGTGINFSRFKKGYFFDIELGKITEEYWDFKAYSRYHKMKNGIIYVGNSEGLYRLTPTTLTIEKPKIFREYFDEMDFNGGVSDFLKIDQKLFIATQNNHTFVYDSIHGEFTQVRMGNSNSEGLIWNLRAKGRDSIWVGTQSGLYIYNYRTKAIGRWERDNLPLGIYNTPVTTHYIDKMGIAWMGMGYGNGLLAHDPKRDTIHYYHYDKNRFPLRTASGIAEDKDGDLWMGYENGGGLIKWDRKSNEFQKIKVSVESNFTNDRIYCLIIDHKNTLWIGTRYGLFNYNLENGTFDSYTVKDGLSDNFILRLYQDKFNRIWMGTANGLNILDYETKRILNIDQNHGIPGRGITSIKEWDTSGNKIFIGATNGFCFIDAANISMDHKGYELYIEPLIINGKALNLNLSQLVKLDYTQNNIAVNFGVINHREGGKNRYYYNIPQIDTSWVELKTKGALKLTGLGPQRYDLNLKTCINGSNCFESDKITLSITPPIWRTPWFLVLIMVLSVFLTMMFYRTRIRNLRRIEGMRNQISMDLHDDIGSSISSVQILSEMLVNEHSIEDKNISVLEAIRDQSSHIGEVLEEIIWNVNPKNDLLENVVARMRQYANEILENSGISVKWNVIIHRKQAVIHSGKRKEIYLFFKEAINNIAKHSKSNETCVDIIESGQVLSIFIKDDGVGYDTELLNLSNGIQSMRRRANNLNASLEIQSSHGEGTTLAIKIPI